MENKFYSYNISLTIIITGVLLAAIVPLVLSVVNGTPAFIVWLTIPCLLISTLFPIYGLRKKVILNSRGFTINGNIEIPWHDVIDITTGFRFDSGPEYGDQSIGAKEQMKILYQYRGKTGKLVVDSSLNNYSIIKDLFLENVTIKNKKHI